MEEIAGADVLVRELSYPTVVDADDQQLEGDAVLAALAEPARQIAINAGEDGGAMVARRPRSAASRGRSRSS